jgi:streptomycin 6-kinase
MDDLASRLSACLLRWELRPGARLRGGARSEVLACTSAAGDEMVLKLAGTPGAARSEAAALTAWSGTGAAVRLLAADPGLGGLLLERIRPGTALPGFADAVAIPVAADLLGRLHQAAPGTNHFPALCDVYQRMEGQAREDARYEQRRRNDPARAVAGLRRLAAARAAALELCATTSAPVLLHGDFLDKNLLLAGDTYLAIDPIPSRGDPCADVGFFAAGHPPPSAILDRAGAIAARLGLDERRARRWAAVFTVLQVCSAWRDDQAELEAVLASEASGRALAGSGGP